MTAVNFIKKNKINILIIIIFLILPLIFFRDTLRLNNIIFGSEDSIRYYISVRTLIIESLKNFELPLWNKYIFNGFPLLASPDIYTLYPPALILDLIFPVQLSYNIMVLLQYSLSGLFMYLFLRELKLNKIACLAGGIIFMFSGNMISHRSLSVYLNVFTWAPLILYFLEKFRKNKKIIYVLAATIFYSISFFGGAQQLFFYMSFVIFTYIIYYAFIHNNQRNFHLLWSLIMFIIFIPISLVQIIPTLELVNFSYFRGTTNYDYMVIDSYDAKLLPSLIFPYIFGCKHPSLSGIPGVLRWFGNGDSVNMIRYFGIITIPLFITGTFKKYKKSLFWIFIFALSFLLVFGEYNPIYKALYYIPIINKFKIPTRIFFITGFAFSIISAYGFDFIIANKIKKIRKIVKVSIIFLSFIFSGFLIFYVSLRYTNLQEHIINFYKTSVNVNLLKESIILSNYSIYMPLILIILSIIFLIILLKVKNKATYCILLIFIFLDLFSMGHFDELNRENIYFSNIRNEEFEYIHSPENEYRILVLEESEEKQIFQPDKNVYYKIDYFSGYDPLITRDFIRVANLSNATYGLIHEEDGIKLLQNNNILSILNTRYIVLPGKKDPELFLSSVSSYIKDKDILTERDFHKNAELNNSIITGKTLTLSEEENKPKLYQKEVKIKSNSLYLISFNIKRIKELDNFIHIDFSGENYNNAEQEFIINPSDITGSYQEVEKMIESSEVPENEQIYFRIFTNSKGGVKISDLNICEITGYQNYSIKYSDEDILILENNNYLPRFYFVENLISSDNQDEIINKLWDRGIYSKDDTLKYDTSAYIEGINQNLSLAQIGAGDKIKINEYGNNKVTLSVSSENDSFLVFSDSYYPGWKAYINGKETRVYRVNGIAKGIFVPAGDNIIKFVYFPIKILALLILSIISFISVLVIILFLHLKNKRSEI